MQLIVQPFNNKSLAMERTVRCHCIWGFLLFQSCNFTFFPSHSRPLLHLNTLPHSETSQVHLRRCTHLKLQKYLYQGPIILYTILYSLNKVVLGNNVYKQFCSIRYTRALIQLQGEIFTPLSLQTRLEPLAHRIIREWYRVDFAGSIFT